MKRTLLYIGIVLSVAIGSVAVYQPAVMAQVAGFFSSISVTSGGTLNGTFAGTATFTNALIASITGNAATATALAAVPTQCSGSTPLASGIAANGNANCTSQSGGIDKYWNAAGCSFSADTNGQSCSLSMTIPDGGFADANYWIHCQAYDAVSSGSWGYAMVRGGSKTTTGFTLTLIEDWGNSAGAGNSWPEIDCHAHHN